MRPRPIRRICITLHLPAGLGRILGWLSADKDIVDEVHQFNIRRFPVVAAFSFAVHASLSVHFLVGVIGSIPEDVSWRREIFLVHFIQTVFYFLMNLLYYVVKRRKRISCRLGRVLPWAVVVDTMAAGIAITAADQRITTNITPFMLVCLFCALAFYSRPFISLPLVALSYAGFLAVIGIHQPDRAVLESNQVNGLAVISLCAGVSVLLWMGIVRNIRQKHIIDQTTRELNETNARLVHLAAHDPLTGLLNRSRFEEHVVEEIQRIRRYRGSAGLLIFDPDDFKRINDRYGHPVGDDVIRHIARLVHDNLRITDAVARWGGEEFSVLLPGIQTEEVRAVAEKIRKHVEANPYVMPTGEAIPITVSIGGSMLEAETENPLIQAYQTADAAMYRAKRLGKNRVCMADDSIVPPEPASSPESPV